MNGDKPIVVNIGNSYQFHEHDTIGAAKREAHRLASTIAGPFVVYVPVAIIEPAPRTIETAITDPEGAVGINVEEDYPF